METKRHPRSEWLISRRLDYKVGKSKYVSLGSLLGDSVGGFGAESVPDNITKEKASNVARVSLPLPILAHDGYWM